MVTSELSYATERRSLSIGSLHVHLDLPIDQFELMLASLAKKKLSGSTDDEAPYWADLWHSAIGLSEVLVAHFTEQLRGRNIIEIGCGLGLPGIIAGLLGGNMIISDYLTEALELAQHNWRLNHRTPGNFLLIDWRNPPPVTPVDFLLASDVAYDFTAFDPLLSAFHQLLLPGGTLFIAEPGRPRSQSFLRSLPNNGFMPLHHWSQPVYLDGSTIAVGVFAFQRISS